MPSFWTQKILACAAAARTGLGLPRSASPVAVVLGSGLGSFARGLAQKRALAFSELPDFPAPTVEGHEGRLMLGDLEGSPVLLLQGRLHGYEGHEPAAVAFPARVLAALGARALVLTNAAGGVNPSLAPGDLMRIIDHLNLTGRNPLTGPNEEALGPRFPDLSAVYDTRLAVALERAAQAAGIALARGVYAQFAGPSYETPAEIRMARLLGADAVGMSTVPEVIAAGHMGVPVCGVSCITNHAAGISSRPLTHAEVVAAAQAAEERVASLLRRFLPLALAAVPGREPLA